MPLQSKHASLPPHFWHLSLMRLPPHTPVQSALQSFSNFSSHLPHLSLYAPPLGVPAQSAHDVPSPLHLPHASLMHTALPSEG